MKPFAFSLVLHAHLPYVKHPEHEFFLEEDWFFEAVCETYLPLLDVLERLQSQSVLARITLVLSPPLLKMMKDDLLCERILRYIHEHIELSKSEQKRLPINSSEYSLSQMYEQSYRRCLYAFDELWDGDLPRAFKLFQEAGYLDLITTAKTHAYLPLLNNDVDFLEEQVHRGCESFEAIMGFASQGFWLPECGYCPELDSILVENGVKYTFVETHGLLEGTPKPPYSNFAPLQTESGLMVFGRNALSSKQVWSAREGFPGAFAYRDFYEDIGFTQGLEHVQLYHERRGAQAFTGLKYKAVMGEDSNKSIYRPDLAKQLPWLHADYYWNEMHMHLKKAGGLMEEAPLAVACYDAELFGHWWYEGLLWLEAICHFCDERPEISLLTSEDYIYQQKVLQKGAPAISSWGQGGYHEMWLSAENDWVFHALKSAMKHYREVLKEMLQPTSKQKEKLAQALEELLLAQSSDWAFLIKTKTGEAYATQRIKGHLQKMEDLLADLIE